MIEIKENKMSLEVLMLESVGSCIDTNGITYPLNIDDTPDLNSGVHIDDCDPEWFAGLSDSDRIELDNFWLNMHALKN
mgnify:CR=1 FL=1|tara:strand:- start:878 stop:1111 length:234 start_codon:yes stop_codon:yes gene_type:complete